jgi:Skp family chaperone for outer membrane proteins
LQILEQIERKSLDKLKDLIGGFSRDAASNDIQDDSGDIEINKTHRGARGNNKDSNNYSQSYSARNNKNKKSTLDKIVTTTATVSNSSIFVPSIDR